MRVLGAVSSIQSLPESREIDSKQDLGVSGAAAVRSEEEGVATFLLFHHAIMAVVE